MLKQIPEWRKKVKLKEVYNISSWLWKWRKYFWKWYPFLSYKTVFNNFFVPDKLEDLVESTSEEQDKYSIKRWDVFITRTSEVINEIGMTCVALKDYPTATFNWFTKRLRPKVDYILPEYIAYFFRSKYFRNQISNVCSIITRASLNNEILKNLEILLPPLPIQQKIASILSKYDDLIENNNKRIKILEQMAQAIYNEMIGKKSEKFLKKSEEGKELPEGWRVEKVENFVNFIRWIEPWSKNYKDKQEEGDIPFIRVKDLNSGNVSTFISRELAKDKIAYLEDVLVSFDWTIGIVKRGLYGCFSSWIRKLKWKTDLITNEFLYLLFKSDLIQKIIKAHAKWTTILHAGGSIKFMKFVLPPENILKKFNHLVKPILDQILNLQLQNQNLKQARDLLIPRLVTGKLNVEDLEIV